jgi:DNA-directed RNA polymerase specialized sigma subunit
MHSIEERFQPVGSADIRGQFSWDATNAVDPDTNDEGLFQCLVNLIRAFGREQALSLLAEGIAQLPPGPKKVLAMYYHENIRLSEIAACFDVTESRICQIHSQAVALLRTYLSRVSS